MPRAELVPLYDLPEVPTRPVEVGAVAPVMPVVPPPSVPAMTPPAPAERSSGPIYRTVVEVVEVPVEVRSEPQQSSGGQPLSYVDPYDDYLRYRESSQPRRGSWVPVNTLVGAGIGAIIGNQSGDSDQGALIGGGIGLLMDLTRW